jgi:hypothetical protein
VVRAFSFEQQKEYSLPYNDSFGYTGHDHILYHRMSGQDSQRAQGISAIGCFRSIDTVCNESIVRWNAGLNQLEKCQLV